MSATIVSSKSEDLKVGLGLKIYAWCLGILCHATFLFAVLLMGWMLFDGFTASVLPIGGGLGRIFNIALLLQFPILHSMLLSGPGIRLLEKFPLKGGKELVSTTFGAIASLQLLAVFLFWTPTADVWFAPSGHLLLVWSFVYGASWILLALAIWEASLPLHSGFLGWSAVVCSRKPQYKKFSTRGLYATCRQPIYLGFSLVILTGPYWTLDHLVCALVWCSYCFVGPRLKERRFVRRYGREFVEYQESVPYFLPRLDRFCWRPSPPWGRREHFF